MAKSLKDFLDVKVDLYNQPSFIYTDPVSIPHLFTTQQDIEISGFFAATFAWGNRTTIIQKSKELMQLMDMRPYEFCLSHKQRDLKRMTHFKHRNTVTTTQNNILGQYFMATFTYNVRPAGVKKKVGGRERLFLF